MATTTSKVPPGNTLLLFGPQTPRLVPARLLELWNTINSNPRLAFLTNTVKTLPSLWKDTVLPKCIDLKRLTSAGEQLQQLVQFFESGTTEGLPIESPYEFLLVPMTVISQIVGYITLDQEGDVQGFCVGFLGAAAVASSHSASDLERWTATAIRLALCIGAIVDINEGEDGGLGDCSTTWSVHWSSDTEEKHLRQTLESFPEVGSSLLTTNDY